ncbi:MAG: hypothetical protein HLUCCA11_10500 [Phormidesmis priestleyi Ana]|uniref:Uncharacterized protein n=1 Tax=Phormidesmis priestleyi Ana TaxID=1666911 RepID=A0A0P8C270_9CYAN|nr:MAG: hypothetical protein HLUCCA11_10500 [Phormidesmis priestleyi Ana]
MTYSTTTLSPLSSVHTANLLAKLSHRLEVARAHQNQSLIVALESEYAQLTAPAQPIAMRNRLQQLWMSFAETLSEWNKVHIERTVDAKGKPSWYAYNPQAGQTIFTESESEMRQWITKSYWGR